MSIEPIVFFDLVISIFILSLALVGLVFYYGKTIHKIHSYRREEEHLKLQMHKKADEIIEEARQKGNNILSQAHSNYDKEESAFRESLRASYANQIKDFEKVSQDFLKTYQNELDLIKIQTIQVLKNISKDIEKHTLLEINDFKDILKKETFASQKIVEQKIEKDYEEAKKGVDAYKAEKLKIIDNDIYKILQTVSMLVLGRTLSQQDHENLIIDALNLAKKEGAL